MFLHLWDVRGWHRAVSCVPTALCAVSACELDRIGRILQNAAREIGRQIPEELQRAYNIEIWLRAIPILGGQWTEVWRWDHVTYEHRPDVNWYMAHYGNEQLDLGNQQLQLVFCENPVGTDDHQTHLFARCGQRFVDIYTCGRVQNFAGADERYLPFRVKRAFAVWPA
jgi:hypothetical protein